MLKASGKTLNAEQVYSFASKKVTASNSNSRFNIIYIMRTALVALMLLGLWMTARQLEPPV